MQETSFDDSYWDSYKQEHGIRETLFLDTRDGEFISQRKHTREHPSRSRGGELERAIEA